MTSKKKKKKKRVHVLLYPYANFWPFLQARPVIINSSYFLVREPIKKDV